VAILDYDNDGKMDIFFTNGAELPSMKKPAAFANALLRNRGDGVFEDRTSAAGLAGGDSGYHIGAAAGDYDNDGDTDLFLANASRTRSCATTVMGPSLMRRRVPESQSRKHAERWRSVV
jgi:hypothetical protein